MNEYDRMRVAQLNKDIKLSKDIRLLYKYLDRLQSRPDIFSPGWILEMQTTREKLAELGQLKWRL